MSNLEIKLNSAGIEELLRSNQMKSLISKRADEIANRCGPGYTVDAYVGKSRVNAKVWTTTKAAMRDNNQNNTLLKSLR